MDPIERLHTEIVQQVVDIGGIVDGVVNRMKSVLGDAIGAVFEPLAAALQGIMGLVAQLVAGLLGDLATPEDIVKSTIDTWLTIWGAEGQNIRDRLAGFMSQTSADVGLRFAALFDKAPENVVAAVGTGDHNHIDPANLASQLAELPGPIYGLVRIVTSVIAIYAYASALQAPGISTYQQAAFTDFPVQPLSPAELAQAVVQNQVGEDWARQHALRSGLSNELFDLVVKTTGDPLPGPQMLDLWRRGVVDESQVDQALRESRLKNQYIESFKALRFVLPSPSDLVRFLVRDAFDDSVASELQTDTDFEAKFSPELFFQVGLSKELAQRYWRAHWQLPSPTQLFEMHHRTSDEATYQSEPVQLPSGRTVHRLISQEFLRRTLQINDLLPPFLDKYRAVSFNPLTRVDARRMFQAGIIDADDLFRTYLDEGYDTENARRLTDWQVQALAESQATDRAKHYAPVIAQIRDFYRDGLIDDNEATTQLTELEIAPDVIQLWLRAEDLVRSRRRAAAIRDGLHRLYVAGFIGEDQARERLASDGYTSSELDRLFDDWHVDLEFKEHGDEERQARELTKANVLDAYKERAIGREEAASLLASLRHAPSVVEFWLADADRDEAKRVNDVLKEAIHADYVDEQIDRPTAAAQLDGIGLVAENREALLRRWTVERRRKEPNLSVSQIEAGFKAEVVDEQTARGMLANLRYAADEIDLLVAVWSQEMSISQQRLELSQQAFVFRQQQAEQSRADRLAREQRQQEAQLARENRTAQQRVEQEARAATAEQARHDRNVQDKVAAEQRANQQREAARQFTASLQDQRLQAADERQARTIDAQIASAQRREAAAEKRQQVAITARVEAEQRRTEAQIERENRQEQAKIRAETRSQQYRIATEQRGERRSLEREARALQAAQTKEERALAARVETERRQAQRAAILQESMAQANQQIDELRRQESQRLSQSAADRQSQLQEALNRRISALQ